MGRSVRPHKIARRVPSAAIRDSRIAVELLSLRSIEQSLRPNRLRDCGARKTARRSSRLLPLLQGSFRDVQLLRGLTLREVLALTPRSELERERTSGQALMPRMMRSCPESQGRKYDAIRDLRIASSSQLEFYCVPGVRVVGGEVAQQSTTAGAATGMT